MSREHKYRLWDNEDNCYYEVGRRGKERGWYWFNVASNGDIITGCDDIIDEPAHVDRWTLEQFTGLPDKNGVEIYHNDLVKDEHGRLMQVVWCTDDEEYDRSGFARWEFKLIKSEKEWAKNFTTTDISSWFAWSRIGIEIIGNIHQHKHLLTGGE